MAANYHYFVAILLASTTRSFVFVCADTQTNLSTPSRLRECLPGKGGFTCHKATNLLQTVKVKLPGVLQETDSRSQSHDDNGNDVSLLLLMQTTLVLSLYATPQLLCWNALLEKTGRQNQDMPKDVPALSSLRYLAVLSIWFGHEYWHFWVTSPLFAMLSGFVLQFAEERRNDDVTNLGAKWTKFFPRRFKSLYPLYATMR
eukprot:TRINITY_DN22366_c0_g1_i2.p1 TRINITY_DN22366_c0_g1~~TRINITY_DN22366_c0_g1_i2.p1  ORF type:complete len:201 (-),score=27.68 TRINITY_DN22366_c0_g1_i2:116-718(-)